MNQMKQLKENFSTFHPQVFHRSKAFRDGCFDRFSTRFGFPITSFPQNVDIYKLNFNDFLTKGSTLWYIKTGILIVVEAKV